MPIFIYNNGPGIEASIGLPFLMETVNQYLNFGDYTFPFLQGKLVLIDKLL